MQPILIVKANGDKEQFDEAKLRRSLLRAEATGQEINLVVEHIGKELEEGITTDRIYRHAFSLLKSIQNPRAMRRYSLRRALLDLGPTGFPFEKYLAAIFKGRGYEVALNQTVQGACASHEIDVVAWNEQKLIMVEAKFHNQLGEKSDLKVVLYVKARFDDLLEQTFEYGGRQRTLDEGWLMTNTKFTENAMHYGRCAKVRMVGWNYPEKGSLRDLAEDEHLHPITCLEGLGARERELLLNNGMVLCTQVVHANSELMRLGISEERSRAIAAEALTFCGL